MQRTGDEILIQNIFGSWIPATEDVAVKFAAHLKARAHVIPVEDRLAHINGRILGLRFESLDEIPAFTVL